MQDKYVFTTIHELEDGRIGVMLYNFNQENNNLHLHIANGYRVVKVVFAKENKGIISLEKNYAYLELVK